MAVVEAEAREEAVMAEEKAEVRGHLIVQYAARWRKN
jgi:hypothetical protein